MENCSLCQAIEGKCTRHTTNEDLFDDIVSLCNKVAHDKETEDKIRINDLIDLRESINELRKRVAQGEGYKAFPNLIKPKGE